MFKIISTASGLLIIPMFLMTAFNVPVAQTFEKVHLGYLVVAGLWACVLAVEISGE